MTVTLANNVNFPGSAGISATIGSKTDDPVAKTVSTNVTFGGTTGLAGNVMTLVLWSGAAYDAVGNWTEDQANAQALSLLGQ